MFDQVVVYCPKGHYRRWGGTRKTLFCKQTSFPYIDAALFLPLANKEGDVMFCCAHEDRPSRIPNLLRKVATGWHKRPCAALLGATILVSLTLCGPASTPAAAQQQA